MESGILDFGIRNSLRGIYIQNPRMSWITLQWGKDIQRPWLMVWRLSTHQTDAVQTELTAGRASFSSQFKVYIFNVRIIFVDVVVLYDYNLALVELDPSHSSSKGTSQSPFVILDCGTPSSNCQECLASGSCKNCIDGFALRLMSENIFGFSNVCDGACASCVEPVSGVQVCNTSQGMAQLFPHVHVVRKP